MTLTVNLIYHYYSKRTLSAEDYFNDILEGIDVEYPYTVQNNRIIYIPVDRSDIKDAKNRGLVLFNKEIEGIGEHPHYIIREMVVAFPSDKDNVTQDAQHIIEKFGKLAYKIQIVEEGLLSNE